MYSPTHPHTQTSDLDDYNMISLQLSLEKGDVAVFEAKLPNT